MLHIILLIWKNSKHYNTPARLVVLMREICNSLIIQACKYSSGEQIFTLIEQEDAAKAVDQLKTTLLVCGTFKSTYFDYKATANAECPANPWRIQVGAVYASFYSTRCHKIGAPFEMVEPCLTLFAVDREWTGKNEASTTRLFGQAQLTTA